ncbi:MAG: 4'-phosphopantetheinyl transferase superfamily protein [Bacteroidales bacterium]|nr:4'-phosphopantetheinyl transferase superfamily protein [Bacteroidales bacterium]
MLYINDHIDTLDWEAHLCELPEARREKCLRFKHDAGRRQCVAVWLLLREALHKEFGLKDVPEVALATHGKPYFPNFPDVHFSLSHCVAGVACAVDTRPVGVDIERVRPFNDDLAAYVFNEHELELVRHAPDPALSFTVLWTQKESLLKLTGEGLRNDMKNILKEAKCHFHTVIASDSNYVCTTAQLMD